MPWPTAALMDEACGMMTGSSGHRRLSVLDPTAAGVQPMRYAARQLVVTYNGEIYNFRELRQELEAAGHHFATNCDTEVLLAAYAEWGTAAVERFNGISAFALWDERAQRLWLVRDRWGLKPLLFDARGLVAVRQRSQSDPRRSGLHSPPNRAGLDSFLSFGFIPAPETGFEDIRQLPPASEIIIENGRLRLRQYWQLKMGEADYTADEAQELFAEKFSKQFASNWSVTSHWVAFCRAELIRPRLSPRCSEPAHRRSAHSPGFEDASFDERSAAAETAQLIGTDHSDLLVKLDVEETVDKFLALNDDPFADSSSLAVFHLCQAAAQRVTVALSGDGAVRIAGGDLTDTATTLAASYRRLPNWSRALVRQMVVATAASDSRYNVQQFASRFVAGAEEPEGRDFGSWRIHFNDGHKSNMCRPDSQLLNRIPSASMPITTTSSPCAPQRV